MSMDTITCGPYLRCSSLRKRLFSFKASLISVKPSRYISYGPFIDWWLSPELYLRRPPARYPEWRIDRVLKRKADQGVRVYVLIYKEVTQGMNMSSRHTKNHLHETHPNIAVIVSPATPEADSQGGPNYPQRHPDHIGTIDSTKYWSHHEKVVVVDQVSRHRSPSDFFDTLTRCSTWLV